MLAWKLLLLITTLVTSSGFLLSLMYYRKRQEKQMRKNIADYQCRLAKSICQLDASDRLVRISDEAIADSKMALAKATKPVERLKAW